MRRAFVLLGGLLAAMHVSAQSLYRNWVDVTPTMPSTAANVAALAIHPLDGRRLIATYGFDTGGLSTVVSSTNSGATWSAPIAVAPNLGYVQSLFSHPGRPGTVYLHEAAWFFAPTIMSAARTRDGRLFTSTDFGATWSTSATYGPEREIAVFASDPLDSERLFATLQFGAACCRLVLRPPVDYGIAIERAGIFTGMDAAGLPASDAALQTRFTARGPTRTAPRRLFFSRDIAYVSEDSGANWKPFSTQWPTRIQSVTPDPAHAQVLYAVTDDPERAGHATSVIRTDDGGATWRAIFPFVVSSEARPIVTVDPAHPDEVWISNAVEGIFHSADGGQHWAMVGASAGFFAANLSFNIADDRLEDYARLFLSPSPGVAFVIWEGRLYRAARIVPFDPVIVEFGYEGDRYWMAATQEEALSQDFRMEPGHVRRTGLAFGAWRDDDAPAGAVGSCRFWPRPEAGHTRVIVQQGFECDILKRDPGWILEAENEFFTLPPVNNACAADTVAVHRFNNLKADFNHRWVADPGVMAEMASRGWFDEGVRFCARPLGANE